MILLTMFLFASGSAYAASRVPVGPILACLILAYPLTFVFGGFMWLNDSAGFTALMDNSWTFLSGAEGPSDVIQHNDATCGSGLSLVMMLLSLVSMVFSAIPWLIAFFGLPIGAIAVVGGGIVSLVTREKGPFIFGASIFAVALGSVVIFGLFLRLEHTLTGIASC